MSIIRQFSFVKDEEALSPFVVQFYMSRKFKHSTMMIRNHKEQSIVVFVERRNWKIVYMRGVTIIVIIVAGMLLQLKLKRRKTDAV